MVMAISAPGGSSLTVAETEVFSGSSPEAWTDLNLSGTVGSQVALVILKVNPSFTNAIAVRKNGDTDEHYFLVGGGVACADVSSSAYGILIIVTDASGIIEWKTESVRTWTIDVIAYIK